MSSPLPLSIRLCVCSFFFNDTATTEIYTLSLHDALPICVRLGFRCRRRHPGAARRARQGDRSEEHTSELQSQSNLVCRPLLEKKNKSINHNLPDLKRRRSRTHLRTGAAA